MIITEKDFPRLHKELWIWCSRNPWKEKYEWPEWKKRYTQYIKNYCFACDYAKIHAGFCPLLRRSCDDHNCLDGLYVGWQITGEDKDYKKRSKIALKIANLPWTWEEVK